MESNRRPPLIQDNRLKSPLRILVILITTIFVVELLIMLVIRPLNLPASYIMLIDATALSFILFPTLFFLIYNPLVSNTIKYQQMKENIEASHNMLLTVLDSLDAIVYVADIKTHELLFLNKYSRDIFGDAVGQTCWSVLQSGQAGPCDFCSNDKIVDLSGKPTGMYEWEVQNTVNKHWYDIRDRAIRWVDGRLVRLEIATDFTEKKNAVAEKERLIEELKDALSQVKALSGIVPICMYCKEIRDDQGYWNQLESFISMHSEAEFSHSICPACVKDKFPDQASRILNKG